MASLEILGVSATPHVAVPGLRYRRETPPDTGALIRVFVRSATPLARESVRLDGKSASQHLAAGTWTWCDFPDSVSATAPAGTLTVLTFNAATAEAAAGPWTLTASGESARVEVPTPGAHLAAATFLGESVFPDRLLLHVRNDGAHPVRIASVRLWLPPDPKRPEALLRQEPLKLSPFSKRGAIAPGDLGGVEARPTKPLPRTFAALEVRLEGRGSRPQTLWAHLKIRSERFDISGGWVGELNLTREPFLKTLQRLHLSAAHISVTPGYTDTELERKYPLRIFNGCQPLDRFDTDALLPRIHGVEFLGEPQYGGGRPVPPQEVWGKLAPFASSRLPTSVTLSEGRTWGRYAGLSDFPHYDAYRVCAPAADVFSAYEWPGGVRIWWGAPLEGVGEMCRSLREQSRPAATAYWSQGAHDGWGGMGRPRSSPTPDELRLQAYHALATRIASLYWFNLQAGSLVKFRDLIDPIARIGREIRLLERFYLEGAAYSFEREPRQWDRHVVAGPRGALLFALDLNYAPDPAERTFRFGEPRPATFSFPLPAYLRRPADVFRIDADGAYSVSWRNLKTGVEVRDVQSRVAIYVATPDRTLRATLEERRRELVAKEDALGFDPARSDADFAVLRQIAEKK